MVASPEVVVIADRVATDLEQVNYERAIVVCININIKSEF